jgi:hypothetical protein
MDVGGLEERARQSGAHCWFEGRMFEILGSWVATTVEPQVKLMVDRHSLHHAWRAAQWEARLSVDTLVAAPAVGMERALDALAGMQGTVRRLAGAYRVALPRLAAGYAADAAGASRISDGSVIRTLQTVAADLHADWREGEFALQALLGDRAAVDAASGAVVELEELLV